LPFIPFFSDTLDTTPNFSNAWTRYSRTSDTRYTRTQCREEYYKQVSNNRVMAGESTIEETEMRTMGYVSKPSEEFVKKIYGDNFDSYITSKRPKVNYNRKVDDDLTNRINQIKTAKPTARRKRPYLDQEAKRRDVSSTRTDDKTVSSGGVGIIMALVTMAIMLLIGIMIFSEVSTVDDNRLPYLNSSADSTGWEVVGEFNDQLLSPFDQIKKYFGDLTGLDDFPMWALLPVMIGFTMLILKMFGSMTARREE